MENYTPNYEARKAALIEEIIAAFDGVSREGGVSMSEAEVIDDYGSDKKRAAARLSDTDTRWQDVSDEQLALNWPLTFFDPIGFRYYLPAYMIYHLRWIDDYIEMGDDAPLKSYGNKALEYALSAEYKKGKIEDFYLSKFKIFTQSQGRAIAHFLQLEAERTDAFEVIEFENEMERFYLTLPEAKRPQKVDMSLDEWEQYDRELFTGLGVPAEDLERLVDDLKSNRIIKESPKNDYRYALKRYWNRFL